MIAILQEQYDTLQKDLFAYMTKISSLGFFIDEGIVKKNNKSYVVEYDIIEKIFHDEGEYHKYNYTGIYKVDVEDDIIDAFIDRLLEYEPVIEFSGYTNEYIFNIVDSRGSKIYYEESKLLDCILSDADTNKYTIHDRYYKTHSTTISTVIDKSKIEIKCAANNLHYDDTSVISCTITIRKGQLSELNASSSLIED